MLSKTSPTGVVDTDIWLAMLAALDLAENACCEAPKVLRMLLLTFLIAYKQQQVSLPNLLIAS